MSEQPASVYVVDDDESVRDALGMLLESVNQPYQAFESGDAFLAAYDNAMRGCIVLDIRMPGMSGLTLQEKLNELDVNLPIIFITGHGDIPMAVEAMRQGALDFIRKPFRDQELLDRINEALNEEARLHEAEGDLQRAKALVASLTPRESEVFEAVCAGHANKVIAFDLGISERTVEIHRSQVMQKSGARSLAELVRLRLLLER